jgi:HD-like signal output (HDOD) protein
LKSLAESTQSKDYTVTHALRDRILTDLMGLPSMPHIVDQALEIIAAEDPSLSHLVSVIETDSAIAAKTLKIANSAYYGFSGRISSLLKAAALLGTRQLTDIIMMAGVSTLLDKNLESYGVESGDLWRHSLAVAFGSRIISSRTAPDLMGEAFAAGLIHNVGKVALHRYILEKKQPSMSLCKMAGTL